MLNTKKSTTNLLRWQSSLFSDAVICCCFFVLFVILFDADSFADGGGPKPNHVHSLVGSAVCNLANAFAGQIAKAIGLFGVIIVGLSAYFGKVSWMTAVVVGVGIGALFAADSLVFSLGGVGCTATFVK